MQSPCCHNKCKNWQFDIQDKRRNFPLHFACSSHLNSWALQVCVCVRVCQPLLSELHKMYYIPNENANVKGFSEWLICLGVEAQCFLNHTVLHCYSALRIWFQLWAPPSGSWGEGKWLRCLLGCSESDQMLHISVDAHSSVRVSYGFYQSCSNWIFCILKLHLMSKWPFLFV